MIDLDFWFATHRWVFIAILFSFVILGILVVCFFEAIVASSFFVIAIVACFLFLIIRFGASPLSVDYVAGLVQNGRITQYEASKYLRIIAEHNLKQREAQLACEYQEEIKRGEEQSLKDKKKELEKDLNKTYNEIYKTLQEKWR